MQRTRTDTLVVGAGVAGLTVGYRLLEEGAEVLICERSARAGGQLYTLEDGGRIVEIGAEGFVARSRAIPALCEQLGLASELLDQNTTDTFVAEEGQLRLLAPGEAATRLGFQVPKEDLGKGIRTLRRGMGQLAETLARRVGARLKLQTAAARGTPTPDARVRVELSDGTFVECRRLVVATEACAAASILGDAFPEAADLANAPLLSSLSVILAYDEAALAERPRASGFIVPQRDRSDGFRACSFVDHKFDGRAPEGTALLRAFFRPEDTDLANLSDAEWVARAIDCIQDTLHPTGPPTAQWVARWRNALPVHDPAHRARVERVEAAVEPRGIYLAGSAFHGAGLDAAVVSAERTATKVRRSLQGSD